VRVDKAGEGEKSVGQAVEVSLEAFRKPTCIVSQSANTTFSSPTHRSSDVRDGGGPTATGEDERRQGFELLIHGINPSLESPSAPDARIMLHPALGVGKCGSD
jgi:hypothetical protein